MIIYAISAELEDELRKKGYKVSTFKRHRRRKDFIKMRIYDDASIEGLVSAIIGATGLVENSIDLLIIDSHGWAGIIWIGRGLRITNVSSLSPLREYMNPEGQGIEIHSCHAGAADVKNRGRSDKGIFDPFSTTGGYPLLVAIANTLGVKVTAGIDAQYPDDWGRIEGPLLQVFPVQ
jgi:hypothetical protein